MGYYRFIGLFIGLEERNRIKQFFEKEYAIEQLHHFRCTHVALDTKNPDYNDIVHAETRIPAVCYATHFLSSEYMHVLRIEVPFPHKKKKLHLTMSIADNERNPGYPVVKSHTGNGMVEDFDKMLYNRSPVFTWYDGFSMVEQSEGDQGDLSYRAFLELPTPLSINGTIDAYRHKTSYRY